MCARVAARSIAAMVDTSSRRPGRRSLVTYLLGAGVASLLLVASACGVADPDVAASFGDEDIAASTVDALMTDEAFAELLGYPVSDSEALIDGDTTRSVLDWMIEGAALAALAEEAGVEVEPDEAALAATIEEFRAQGYGFTIEDLGDEAREVLALRLATEEALAGAVEVFEPTEDDVVFAFEAIGESGRWSETCLDMVGGEPDLAGAARSAIDEGFSVLDLTDEVPGMQLALESSQQCATGADLATLPPELAEQVADAPIGEVVGPVEVSQGGQTVVVVFVVESRNDLGFEDVREELTAEVAQSLLAVRIARGAEVNPRYGAGVELELVQGAADPTGVPSAPVLAARVARPEAPGGSAQ